MERKLCNPSVIFLIAITMCILQTSAVAQVWVSQKKNLTSCTIPAPIVVASGSTTFCKGDSITLSVQPNSGYALKLNGSNQSANLGNWFTLPSFTIELWVKAGVSQLPYANLIDNNHTDYQGWDCEQVPNITNVYGFGHDSTTVVFRLTPNVWQHLALVLTPTFITVYLNGALVDSARPKRTLNYKGVQQLILGNWAMGGRNWNGSMDEVKMYNTNLTPAQIRQDMFSETSVSPSALVAYYKMDEGSGTTIASTTGSHPGTLVNTPAFTPSGVVLGGYKWHPTNDTTTSISVKQTGTYTVTQTNAAGCTGTSAPIVITVDPVLTPSLKISASASVACAAKPVQFSATATNAGTNPSYQWKKNNVTVGQNSSTYTDSTLAKGDSVWCIVISTAACTTTPTATSNKLRLSVVTPITKTSEVHGCNSVVYNGVTYTASTIKRDTIKSRTGCDSVYQITTINVSVIKPVRKDTTIKSCGPVTYQGITYTSSKTIVDTIRNTYGCDSIYRRSIITILSVPPTPIIAVSGSSKLCAGDSVKLSVRPNAGYALSFNGVTQHANLGTWCNKQTFTAEMWLKPDSTQVMYANIIDNNHQTYVSWVCQQDSIHTNQYGFGRNNIVILFKLIPGTWQHLALVSTSSSIAVYVNGILIDSKTGIAPIKYDSTEFLRLAEWGGGATPNDTTSRPWKGQMDEVKLYAAELTQQQIKTDMLYDAPVLPTALVDYYRMNEGKGDTITSYTRAHTGRLINNPAFVASGVLVGKFSWQPGGETTTSIIAKKAASYTVSVTNAAGCSKTSAPVAVSMSTVTPPKLSKTGSTPFCIGDSLVVSTAITGIKYQWLRNNTAIKYATTNRYAITIAGSYKLKISDSIGTCSAMSDSVIAMVTEIPKPTITLRHDTLISSSSSGNQWFTGSRLIPGATSQKYAVRSLGYYSVQVTANNCVSPMSDQFVYTANTLMKNKPAAQLSVELYPNPATDVAHITIAGANGTVTIILRDLSGKVVWQQQTAQKIMAIPISALAAGWYSVSVQDNIHAMTKTFIKTKQVSSY